MKSRIFYTPSGGAKKQRGLRTMIFPIALSATVLLICGGVIFALREPRLQIRNITLRGIKTLDERAVRDEISARLTGARFYVLPRSSFFLADTAAIASGLKHDFSRIRDVTAVKNFPDKLDISVTERIFWGVFCDGLAASSTPACPHTQCLGVGACVYIDPEAIAYEHAPEPQGKLILSIRSDAVGDIALGASALDPAVMGEIRNLAERIPAETGSALAGFELHSRVPSEIRAVAGEGFTMIFKREDDYTATLRVLKRVLDGEIKDRRSRMDYIDLRFGNKVFYKLK